MSADMTVSGTEGPALMSPLAEKDRQSLMKLIEQRKKELEEKRKLVEALMGQKITSGTQSPVKTFSPRKSQTSTPTPASPTDSSELLKEVLTQVANIQPPPPTGVVPIKIESIAAPGTKDKDSTKAMAKYIRQFRKKGGVLGKAPGVASLTITARAVDFFDKSIQAGAEAPLSEELPPPPKGRLPAPTRGDASAQQQELVKRPPPTKVSPEEVVALRKDPLRPKVSSKENESQLKIQIEPMPEVAKREVLHSKDFNDFFSKASKLVERVLGEAKVCDILTDYSQFAEQDTDTDATKALKPLDTFVDNQWTAQRPVTDLRVHPQFSELFLASYGLRAEAAATDADGCVAIWNLSMAHRPEYTFLCHSQVCTAMFDPYRPHLILGGVYTGGILLWDMRAKARPVQRTPLNTNAHLHPISAMDVIGTQNAHNLVTLDYDGRLCQWSLSMLVNPTQTIDFRHDNREVTTTCFGFPEGETNVLYGGFDVGGVFQAHMHATKAGISNVYPGHKGPVTALNWHPQSSSKPADFSYLCLTSSLDWTIKLWSPKHSGAALHTFETPQDPVMDCRWHPSHPSLFAACDAGSHVEVWNLSRDTQTPLDTLTVGSSPLNKLAWSRDGLRLHTGDAEGHVRICGLAHKLANPRNEEYELCSQKIDELRGEAAKLGAVL